MSHIVSLSKINQFLPKNKLELTSGDHNLVTDLEETARDIVVSKLGYRIDTTVWFNPVDPPDLIYNIMGMLIAGWVHDRQFAEEAVRGATYGMRKESEAYRLMEGILSGEYKLAGADYIDDPDRVPSVYESDPLFEVERRY